MLDQNSESMSDRKQGVMSDKMYEYMSNHSGKCQSIFQIDCPKKSGRMSEYNMPDRMSNRMSGFMPEKLPAQSGHTRARAPWRALSLGTHGAEHMPERTSDFLPE